MSRRKVSAGILAIAAVRGSNLLAHPGGPYWRNRDDGVWLEFPERNVETDDLLACAKREFNEERALSLQQSVCTARAASSKERQDRACLCN